MGYNDIPASTNADFQYESISDYGQQYTGTGGYEHKGLLTGTLVAYNKDALASLPNEPGILANNASLSKSVSAKYYDEAPLQLEPEVASNASALPPTTNPGDITGAVNLLWEYLGSVMYYDYKGQLIQTKSQNHLSGVEKEYMAYNFTGQVTKKQHIHSATGKVTQTEIYTYTYDHAGRMTETRHKLNTGTEIVLVANTYDELGRLKTNTPNNQNNLKTTFDYNIRSWVEKITGALFSENMTYTYNGNISSMQWWEQNRRTRTYNFEYDNLSRLKQTDYSGMASFDQFSENYSYDKHGNITQRSRYGMLDPHSYGLAEDFSFTYDNSNQIKQISCYKHPSNLIDANITVRDTIAWNQNTTEAFSEALWEPMLRSSSMPASAASTTNTGEYTYNRNGALQKDTHKGITDITYNELNLPKKIDIKNSIAEARNEYTYTTTGAKLKVVHRWNPSLSGTPVTGTAVDPSLLTASATTDYAVNKIYENGVLTKILTGNGYYENGKYYFYIQNHLGSNAVVADETGAVVQQTHYYPFGETMNSSTGQEKQAFKYTGQELDMMHGLNLYDYKARFYDPNCDNRFMSIDPLAEKYYNISPYAYCLNNPVLFIDPDGMSTHLNRLGYIVQENDDDDEGVYYHNDLSNWDSSSTLGKKGDGVHNIGSFDASGGTIDINDIYTNLLNENSSIAKSTWSPFTFKKLVKKGGDWDYKNNTNFIYGKLGDNDKLKFLFQGKVMEVQDVGNHHFGVVTKAYGWFSEEFALKQAGQAQIDDGTSRAEWQIYETVTIVSPTGGITILSSMQPPYGDDPRDQMWIKAGFTYYINRKK
jgi:RHS repeat-associated protein